MLEHRKDLTLVFPGLLCCWVGNRLLEQEWKKEVHGEALAMAQKRKLWFGSVCDVSPQDQEPILSLPAVLATVGSQLRPFQQMLLIDSCWEAELCRGWCTQSCEVSVPTPLTALMGPGQPRSRGKVYCGSR
jgi:hypothetical protein